MNRRLQAVVFLVVAAAAGFSGYHFNLARLNAPASASAAQALLQAPLADLNGKMQTLSQARGKVLVVNFWATWCPPCRKEIPELMKIQNKYLENGVKIFGIAVDNAANVREFAGKMRINYSLLIGGMEVLDLSKDLGNQSGVLPYTVVLDRAGTVVYTHAGALTEAELDVVLLPLLQVRSN